jgi:hypothetical protein
MICGDIWLPILLTPCGLDAAIGLLQDMGLLPGFAYPR